MAQTPTQALRDNTVLTQENLDDNGIGVKGVEARADNTVLTKLSMADAAPAPAARSRAHTASPTGSYAARACGAL